jgi:hypothetical protein
MKNIKMSKISLKNILKKTFKAKSKKKQKKISLLAKLKIPKIRLNPIRLENLLGIKRVQKLRSKKI